VSLASESQPGGTGLYLNVVQLHPPALGARLVGATSRNIHHLMPRITCGLLRAGARCMYYSRATHLAATFTTSCHVSLAAYSGQGLAVLQQSYSPSRNIHHLMPRITCGLLRTGARCMYYSRATRLVHSLLENRHLPGQSDVRSR
jgi:hypothetical protein